MEKIECNTCGKLEEPSKLDDAFCQTCFNRIEKNCEMNRVRAARCLIETSGCKASRLAMYAFLSIFHPEMTHLQKKELSDSQG
jgi:hypothetical protein